ncbi:dipeptidyl peptidase 3-like [Tropilaelaps mercedesae]|uniref:Dipeptidyl peptidase 3-like n=1 Tax=Tropilaelaps mercedesae TaxID=418985 RepID=A0A1V9XUY3_9ACAR|nr:dipeptidyl peptidase 3-like [Tropilaelaps mercedesae]
MVTMSHSSAESPIFMGFVVVLLNKKRILIVVTQLGPIGPPWLIFLVSLGPFKKVEPWNQRVIKNSATGYELRVASADGNISKTDEIAYNQTEMYEERFYTFTPLDYSSFLSKLANLLHLASSKVRGDLKEIIILHQHFLNSGSVKAHKSASAKWIKESNVVEFYLGFLDTSKDPAGQRGLFQSIAGVINREKTARLDKFLLNINDTTRVLPWPTKFKVLSPVKSTMRAIDVVAMTPPVPTALSLPSCK